MRPVSVQGRTLSEQVVHTLRQVIVDGDLPPGTRLMDAELAEQLQVSRPTIRDAFRRLQHEGIIINHPHRGYFVAEFRREDVEELLLLRGLLEGRAAEIAVGLLTEEDFCRLEEIADAIATQDYQQDIQSVRVLDIRLHDIVIQRSGLALLPQLWAILNSRLTVLNALSAGLLKVDADDSSRRHHDYIAALRSRDPSRARVAAEQHYQHYVDRLRAVLHEPDGRGDGEESACGPASPVSPD